LATTNPTRGSPPAAGSLARCTTSDVVPLRAPRRTACSNSAGRRMRDAAGSTEGSGGELGAALAAARGEDRAAGTGAHPQAEAVGLRAAPVVRLEGPLAHEGSPTTSRGAPLGTSVARSAAASTRGAGRRDWRAGTTARAVGAAWQRYSCVRRPVKYPPARAISLDRELAPGRHAGGGSWTVSRALAVPAPRDAATEGHGKVARTTQGVDNCVDRQGPCDTSGRMSDDLQRG